MRTFFAERTIDVSVVVQEQRAMQVAIGAGVDDDAFQPVTGDDKTTAAGLRRRNKKEREDSLLLAAFGERSVDG